MICSKPWKVSDARLKMLIGPSLSKVSSIRKIKKIREWISMTQEEIEPLIL
jgi:hypothetical protein